MDYKKYVITLHKHEDLEEFYHDLETAGGSLCVPDREVELVNRRPYSRNTEYLLTDQEAQKIAQDPRVSAVELDYKEQNLKVEPSWQQTANFYKGHSSGSLLDLRPDDKNWGLLRCINSFDTQGHGNDAVSRVTATVKTQHGGKNIDIVIVDGHIRPSHVEFAVNSDGTGGSRVKQINWFDFSVPLGKTTGTTYLYNNQNSSLGNHGAAVASIAAGNTQGWARHSEIYNISPFGDNLDMDGSDVLDYVRYWHNNKAVNPLTGRRNATVINNSWGIYSYINVKDITEIVHRGISYTGVFTITGIGSRTYQKLDLGHNGAQQYFLNSGDVNYYLRISYPVAAWQADAEDCVNDGIHVITAAGNDGLINDKPGGLNYDNRIKTLSMPLGFYYNRRSGNANESCVLVGSIGSSGLFPGIDDYTNRGPAIDICAPGSDIVCAINDLTGIVDHRSLNNDHISIFSGTSFAAPQVSGILASLLEYFIEWTPASAKFYVSESNANLNHLFDYPAPRNLSGTPNRYLRYTFLTTTTTTSTSSTSTTTSTSSTSTSSSSTTTVAPNWIPLNSFPISLPLIYLPVPEMSHSNVIYNVAWYSVTILMTMSMVITTEYSSDISLDTEIAVFSAEGYLIAENDDSGYYDFSKLILENLPPGTYYIGVCLFEATYTSPFRWISLTPLRPGITLTVYEKGKFPVSTSTTSTSTSTSTSSTSTTSSSTSTTTYPPTSTTTTLPPTWITLYTWCNNFDYWGLFRNERMETYSAVIEHNSVIHCGYTGSTTTTTTTTTEPFIKPITHWDPTVDRLSSVLNFRPINKIPRHETNFVYNFAGGQLPVGLKLKLQGNITGIPYQLHNAHEQPIYNHTFTSFNYDPVVQFGNHRTYTMGVVMDQMMTVDNHDQDDISEINNSYSFVIHNVNYSAVDPAVKRIWRVKYGVLPPLAELDDYGTITVRCNHSIKPFVRKSFVNTDQTDSRSDQRSWNQWLKNYFSEPQEFDYQFVCEFGLPDQPPEIGCMIRIIHTTVPNTGTWFVNNGIVDNTGKIYYLVFSTHRSALFWETGSDLGVILNGTISEKSVKARATQTANVSYKFREGQYSLLPQGLRLHRNGLIYGRCSFRTREVDTVSVPTNNIYKMTIRAGIENYKIYADKQFTLTLKRRATKPGDDIYIAAYPKIDTKQEFLDFINNEEFFPEHEIYRYEDPHFGRIKNFFIRFAVGLEKTAMETYEELLTHNHFQKIVYFDETRVSYVLDKNNKVEYEVVYATLKDLVLGRDQKTLLSQAQLMVLDLTGKIKNYYDGTYKSIEPNDLKTMQNTFVKKLSFVPEYSSLLDRWQTSLQPTTYKTLGEPVGFIPAVPLVFVKPGFGANVLDRLKKININRFVFEFDRYQFDNYLSTNFDATTNQFTAAVLTIFDSTATYFDSNSCQIIDSIDYAIDPRNKDKYLKFGKTNLFK